MPIRCQEQNLAFNSRSLKAKAHNFTSNLHLTSFYLLTNVITLSLSQVVMQGLRRKHIWKSVYFVPWLEMSTFLMSSKVNFEDISLCCVLTCQPDMANMLPTLQLCCVVSLIANMSAMQQLASVGEARGERRQCDERGVGSRDATKSDKTTASGCGSSNGQLWRRRQIRGDSKYNNQTNTMTTTMTTAMMTGQHRQWRQTTMRTTTITTKMMTRTTRPTTTTITMTMMMTMTTMTTTMMTTMMMMTERREEAWRRDKRCRQCMETANGIDVKTGDNNGNDNKDDNGMAGGSAAARGGAAAQQTMTTMRQNRQLHWGQNQQQSSRRRRSGRRLHGTWQTMRTTMRCDHQWQRRCRWQWWQRRANLCPFLLAFYCLADCYGLVFWGRNIWVSSQTDTNRCLHHQICVGDMDPSGKNWSNIMCQNNMLLTCRQHFQPSFVCQHYCPTLWQFDTQGVVFWTYLNELVWFSIAIFAILSLEAEQIKIDCFTNKFASGLSAGV